MNPYYVLAHFIPCYHGNGMANGGAYSGYTRDYLDIRTPRKVFENQSLPGTMKHK